MSVLLVSRDSGLRAIVRWGLERSIEARITGEIVEWWQAPRLTADLRPDVVVLDAATVPEACIPVLRAVKAVRPETRVVVLTAPGEGISVVAAEATGADRAIDRETFIGAFLRPARDAPTGSGLRSLDRRLWGSVSR